MIHFREMAWKHKDYGRLGGNGQEKEIWNGIYKNIL